jgi:hypothetical protein
MSKLGRTRSCSLMRLLPRTRFPKGVWFGMMVGNNGQKVRATRSDGKIRRCWMMMNSRDLVSKAKVRRSAQLDQ